MNGAIGGPSPSSATSSAALVEELEPLSPGSMETFERLLRVGGWARAVTSARAEPSPATELAMRSGDADLGRQAAPTPQGKAKSAVMATKRRNRHREREKRELMYLRACSQLFERRLEELRQHHARMTDVQRRGAVLQSSRSKLWRLLAMRQRHERGKSEEENARLRALWWSQLQFVEQLQQLTAVPRGPGPANGHEARVTFGDFDADVLATLVRDLDALYAQSGRALAGVGLMDAPEACFARVQHHDTGNVDLLDVALLQPDYPSMRVMTWDRILSKFLARGGVRIDSPAQQNGRTLAMKIRYSHAAADTTEITDDGDGDGEDTHFEIVLALRQYIVSPSREVVVWKSLNTGGGRLAGLAAHEMGYCVMHQSIEKRESTTLKRLRRLELLEDRAAHGSAKAELFSNLSLAVMEDDVRGALRACSIHERS